MVRVAVSIVLAVGCTLISQGCALLLVGAAAGGAAVGTVSYVANELRVVQETTMDKAWSAAQKTVSELELIVNQAQSKKDQTGALLLAKTAKDQPVRIELLRAAERRTEVRIRVGTFDTAANKATAQLIYDKMKSRM